MTRSEALDIVIRIAARWGENAEERLPRRVKWERRKINEKTASDAGHAKHCLWDS